MRWACHEANQSDEFNVCVTTSGQSNETDDIIENGLAEDDCKDNRILCLAYERERRHLASTRFPSYLYDTTMRFDRTMIDKLSSGLRKCL